MERSTLSFHKRLCVVVLSWQLRALAMAQGVELTQVDVETGGAAAGGGNGAAEPK